MARLLQLINKNKNKTTKNKQKTDREKERKKRKKKEGRGYIRRKTTPTSSLYKVQLDKVHAGRMQKLDTADLD